MSGSNDGRIQLWQFGLDDVQVHCLFTDMGRCMLSTFICQQ
jgi:hypothetical protein